MSFKIRVPEEDVLVRPVSDVGRGIAKAKVGSTLLKPEKYGKKKIRFGLSPKKIRIAPRLSQEQAMLGEMFGGADSIWGTGQNLPQMNETLTSGHGLVKSGDDGETGSMFGVRRRRW